MEQTHLRLGKRLQRGGITIAGSLVGTRSRDTEIKPIGRIRAQGAVLVDKAHSDISQVVAIGLDGLALGLQQQALGFAGCADNLLSGLVAIFVINHHLQLARLIDHVAPTQAIAVKSRGVILGDAALALAVDKEFGAGIVGVAVDGSYLALAVGPRPMRQQVDGVLRLVPVAAVQVVAVLGQTCEVADAEVLLREGQYSS